MLVLSNDQLSFLDITYYWGQTYDRMIARGICFRRLQSLTGWNRES